MQQAAKDNVQNEHPADSCLGNVYQYDANGLLCCLCSMQVLQGPFFYCC